MIAAEPRASRSAHRTSGFAPLERKGSTAPLGAGGLRGGTAVRSREGEVPLSRVSCDPSRRSLLQGRSPSFRLDEHRMTSGRGITCAVEQTIQLGDLGMRGRCKECRCGRRASDGGRRTAGHGRQARAGGKTECRTAEEPCASSARRGDHRHRGACRCLRARMRRSAA